MKMTENERVIRSLYEITSHHEKGFPEQTRELLSMGCERFGLDIGILSHIEADRYQVVHQVSPKEVPLEDNIKFNLPETYCAVTIAANMPVGYEHVGKSDLNNHPAYAAFQLESYFGIPVVVNGAVYGTLNFSSPFPSKRKFSEIDIDALKIMAIWIEGELNRLHYQQKILQQTMELEATNTKLEAMTRTDNLTQVGNRYSFFDELEKHLRLSQRQGNCLSIVMFDLDDFKNYNDSYGHVAGDVALVKVAKIIADHARTTDYVARYGGEEFIVLMPDSNSDNAVFAAGRLRAAIEAIDTLERSVTGSFGVSTFESADTPVRDYSSLSERLVDEADKALYYSKELGKNRVCHYAQMTSRRVTTNSA